MSGIYIHILPLLLCLGIGLVPPALMQAAQPTPEFFINDRSQKYGLAQAALVRYDAGDGRQVIARGQKAVYNCPGNFKIVDYDLTGDGQTQVIGVLFSNLKSTYLEICDLHTGARLLIKNMTGYQPWKVCFADVDQDSIYEVCLGVYKRSPLHPLLTKRLFIYDFHHGLQPKWLGSRLAHPFTDFDFIVTKNKTILVSLELDNQARPWLNAYEWDCFGFTGVQTRFNTAIDNAVMNNAVMNNAVALSPGYILENGIYRRVLFVVNQDSLGKVIDMEGLNE